MPLVASPTEITTSLTDAILAVESTAILLLLWRNAAGNRWKAGVWCWIFGLLAFASLLGAVVHGVAMPRMANDMLWKPLYLSLGIAVSLFLVGGLFDWQGRDAAKKVMPWAVLIGTAFYAATELFSSAFIIFVVYEAVVMTAVMGIYIFLAVTGRLTGAGVIAAAIVLNLVAAGIQASDMSISIGMDFDHNGVFHLVQMAATALLGTGLYMGMKPFSKPV